MAEVLEPFLQDRARAVATQIIARYGGLGRALVAEPAKGDQDLAEAVQILRAAHRLIKAALSEDLDGSPVRASDPRLLSYLRVSLIAQREERLHAIFLDRQSRYLRDELIATGGHKSVHVPVRHLFGRALELNAAGIILAHNHPSGDCSPSRDDRTAHAKLSAVAAALDIELIDHLIVTRRAIFSLALERLL